MLSKLKFDKYPDKKNAAQQAVDFFIQHSTFFCAPFDPFMVGLFQAWAKNHENEIKPLSDAIWAALRSGGMLFPRALASYHLALFALRDGYPQDMCDFICIQCPAMLFVILRHQEDKIFSLWNEHFKQKKYQYYVAAIITCRQQLAIVLSQCISREPKSARIAQDYSLKADGAFAVTLPEKNINCILQKFKKNFYNYLHPADFFYVLAQYAFFLKAESVSVSFGLDINQDNMLKGLYQHFASHLEIFTNAFAGRFLKLAKLLDFVLVDNILLEARLNVLLEARLKVLSNLCFNGEQCQRITNYIFLLNESEFDTFVEFLEDSLLAKKDDYPLYAEAYVRIVESHWSVIQSMEDPDFLVLLEEQNITIETYLKKEDKMSSRHSKRMRADRADVTDEAELPLKKQKVKDSVRFFCSGSNDEEITKSSDRDHQILPRRQG